MFYDEKIEDSRVRQPPASISNGIIADARAKRTNCSKVSQKFVYRDTLFIENYTYFFIRHENVTLPSLDSDR